jgi:hypothetical protein
MGCALYLNASPIQGANVWGGYYKPTAVFLSNAYDITQMVAQRVFFVPDQLLINSSFKYAE